jgi:DNA-binding beta-propeller fold protein YncE
MSDHVISLALRWRRGHDPAVVTRFPRQYWILAAVIWTLAGIHPAQAEPCPGDCNGDGTVGLPELISCVAVSLGSRDVRFCPAADGDGNGVVGIAEILRAVGRVLNNPTCVRDTFDVPGVCQQPGGRGRPGLKPCDSGTVVNGYRCGPRETCLDGVRALIGSSRVGDNGAFTISLDRIAANDVLVLEALIVGATITPLRAIDIGSAFMGLTTGRSAGLSPMVVSPFSEAAVRIFDDRGLENFSDDGIDDVVDAVGSAAAAASYTDVDAERAVMIAFNLADGDPQVEAVIAAAMRDMSPTPTAATPPTQPPPTSTPTVTRTRTATPTLPPPLAIAYVAYGNNELALIDLDTEEVIDRFTLGTPPTPASPRDVTASADGRIVLVANEGADSVTVIDARRREIVGETPDSRSQLADQPKTARIAPGTNLAYVVNAGTNRIDVFDLTGVLDGKPIEPPITSIRVGDKPLDIAITRGRSPRNVALVSNNADATISIIDVVDNVVLRTLDVGHPVARIALTPDSKYAYVTTESQSVASTDDVLALDVDGAVAGDLNVSLFTVGSGPSGVVVLPDGLHVLVTTGGDPGISIIQRDPVTNPFGRTPLHNFVMLLGQPNYIGIRADGRVAYVTNLDLRSVAIVDTALAIAGPLDELISIRDVGLGQRGIAIVDKPD